MKISRLYAGAAAATIVLGLSACGDDTTSSNPPTSTSSSTSSTSSTSSSASSSTSSTPSSRKTITTTVTAPAAPSAPAAGGSGSASTGGSSPTGSGSGSKTPTRVVGVWPDSGWDIENSDSDICAGYTTGERSPYSLSHTAFMCGANADSLLACQKESGGNVLCIQNWAARKAVRFPSDISPITTSDSSEPTPLQVVLDNGDTCSYISHDQEQHYGDRHSWLYCDENGVLLLPPGTDEQSQSSYFDKSAAHWTAQYSVNNAAPTTVGVAQAFFAK